MDITIHQAAQRLLEQDNITVLCHRSPDGDTLGSGYALCHGLASLGKRCRLRCADAIPGDMLPFLGTLGDEPATEDFVVAVDVADRVLLGSLEADYGQRVDLVVDHHPSNTRYGRETCLDTQAASTTQLMAQLLEAMQATLTPTIAGCIYLGLATDTGCFRYSNTTADTLRTAARMLDAGLDAYPMNKVLFETKKPGRLAVECHVLQNLEYYYQRRCAVMTVLLETVRTLGATEDELDGLSALPRQIDGVWVGVTIREQEAGARCRISVRTNSQLNASTICAAFGGGGHMRAAGCTILAGVEQAKALLVAEIGRHLESEGAHG